MKSITPLLTILLLAWFNNVSGQEYNPYKSIGKKAKILTAYHGKFVEVFDYDSVQRIGSVLFNINKKKIVKLLKSDRVFNKFSDNSASSRWYSPDPLADKFHEWSPYTFVKDNPIRYVDTDGRAPLDNYYIDKAGNLLAVQRTNESVDRFYEVSDDGNFITNVAEYSKGQDLNNSAYARATDNDKVAAVNYETKHPNSGTDGYGVMKTDPVQGIVKQEADSKNPNKIIGAIKGADGTVKAIRQSDPINPGGANPAAILPKNSNIPAPQGEQSKAALPSGSLPKNLPASSSNVQAVTDSKGNYIPPELQKPKI